MRRAAPAMSRADCARGTRAFRRSGWRQQSSSVASAAASPASFTRCLPRAAVALGLALAGLLAVSTAAQAQTAYVSNIGQSGTSSAGVSATGHQGQAFTTGSQSGGYALGSVGAIVENTTSDFAGLTVRIYTVDADGLPDSVVYTLTNPGDSVQGGTEGTFVAPGAATLSADTTYIVTFEASGTFSNSVRISNRPEEDSGLSAGWSIANRRHFRAGSGGTWAESSNEAPAKIAVYPPATVTNTAATGQPDIAGTPQVGQTLTAGAGDMADANGLPTTTFPDGYTFQWVSRSGGTDTDIAGATAQTYTPVAADIGNRLKVKVSFTDGGNTSETLTSEATETVVRAAEDCATDRPGHDWCATMTVGVTASSAFTRYGYAGNNGQLDNPTIDYGPSYEIQEIRISVSTGFGIDSVRLGVDPFLPSGSVFDLGGTTFSAESSFENLGFYLWSRPPSFAWLDGQKVTVSANLAPLLNKAEVNGRELVLTFYEDLDESSMPAPTNFGADADGTIITPFLATVSGDTVTLMLSSEVTADQTVTVFYSRPSADPLRDRSGLAASSFGNRKVTNNTPNADPTGQPDITGVPQVGKALTAAKGNIADANGLPDNFPDDYSFQWVSVDAVDNETEVGTDSPTYTPTSSDVGRTIKVNVSFTDGANKTETLTSEATRTVVSAAEDCATDRPHNDWCTTMTVGLGVNAGDIYYGYWSFLNAGQLDDPTIDYGPSYEVLNIGIVEESGGVTAVTAELDMAVPVGSVFDLGGTAFTAGAAIVIPGGRAYNWNRPMGFAWLDGQAVTVSANLAPLLKSAEVEGTTLTLTYHEDLDTGSTPPASAYAVTVTDDMNAVTNPTVTGVSISGDEVTLTLSATVGATDTVTLDYTAPTTNPIQDVSGLDAPSFSGREVDTEDNTAPILDLAEVSADGRTMLLTFSEDLHVDAANPLPQTGDFTVKASGVELPVSGLTRSGSHRLLLTLGAVINALKQVEVIYTVPATGRIRDAAGNETAGFRFFAVNESTVLDARGLFLTPEALEVNEGTTGSYTVALTEAPTGTVTVTLTASEAGLRLSPATLFFTTSDWNIAQRINVTAGEDDNAVDETVTLTHTPSGGGYDGASLPDLAVTVADNDGGVLADPTELTLAEGASAGYGLTLTRRPTADVTVTVTGDGGKVDASPATLTFTPDNWDASQTVTVSGVQDTDKRDETVTLRHAATGGGYAVASGDARSAPVRVTVEDDEATAPGPPELRAGAGNEAALLRWTPPADDGGAPVTGYEYRRGTGAAQPAESLTGHTVRGLVNGTEYTFQVRAVNRIGEGTWSAAKTVVPVPLTLTVEALEDEVTEGEPVRYRVVMSNPTDWVTVDYVYRHEGDFMRSPVTSSGGGIRSEGGSLAWEVERDTVDDGEIEAHGSFTVEIVPGAGYAVGAPSSATVRILDNDGGAAPGTVPGLSVRAVSPTMLEARWRAAASGGAPVTGYALEYRAGSSGPWTAWPEAIGPDARSVRLADLSPGTAYQARVRAENVRGPGPWSAAAGASTAPDPGVTVSIGRSDRSWQDEGATLKFAVTAQPAPASALRVDVRVTETLSMLAGSAPTSVTVPAGQGTVEFEVRTRDDSQDEGDSEVTAALQPSVRYVLGEASSATYTVRDDEPDTGLGRVGRPRVERIVDPRTPEHIQESLRAAGEEPRHVLRFAWDAPADVGLAGVRGWEVQWAEVADCTVAPPPAQDRWPGRMFWLVSELDGTEVLHQTPRAAHFRVRTAPLGVAGFGPWSEPVCGDMAASATASATASGAPERAAPAVTSVEVQADADGDGVWSPGEAVTVTVAFSQAVRVRTEHGTPSVTVHAGGVREAPYAGGSGTAALSFAYEVGAADGSVRSVLVPENALKLNGGAIAGPAGVAAELSHAGAARSGTPRGTRSSGAAPALSVADAAAQEGATLVFAVTLAPAAPGTVRVDWATSDGTARAGADYKAGSGTLSFAPGETSRTVRIAVFSDAEAEGAETMGLVLSNASGASLAGARATGTVSDPPPPPVPAEPPPAVSIADAKVREGPGAVLAFAVTLDGASRAPASVDWETRDANARAGEDYAAGSGTLRFAPGETSKTIRVAVHDDAVDEGREVMLVVLSNPVGATVAKASAGGVIDNADPMPRAWLARFGRTAAEQVLDAVDGRLRAAPEAGVRVTVGGRRLGDLAPDAEALGALEAKARLEGFSVPAPREACGGGSGEPEACAADTRERTPRDLRDLLRGSSFALTTQAGGLGGGLVSLWGREAVTRFDARQGELSLGGEVTGALLGADVTRERATLGVMLSHARGEGAYRGADAGAVASTLTGLYPYGRYALNGRVTVWGTAGYGAGTLTLTPEDKTAFETGMETAMAAAGLRGTVLAAPPEGGPELAVKTDALAVRTASEAVAGSAGAGGNLAAGQGDVTRLRLGLEGTWKGLTIGTGALTPRLEIGVRHDGGDAEAGFGVDVGGGFAWSDPGTGIRAEASGRGLLTHESAGFGQRGFAGSFGWDPRPQSERGPSVTLTQSLGLSARGGVDALLGRATMAGLAAREGADGLERRRLELRLGYGFGALGGRFTSRPEAGYAASGGRRETSLGWRLVRERSHRGHGSLEFALEMRREQNDRANAPPAHGAALRLDARW